MGEEEAEDSATATAGPRGAGNVSFSREEDHVNKDLASLRMRSLMSHSNQKVAQMAHTKPTVSANLETDLEFHFGDLYNRKIGVDHRQNIPYNMGQQQTAFVAEFAGHPEVRHSALPGILVTEQINNKKD